MSEPPPGTVAPEFVAIVRRVLLPFVRVAFRPTLSGLEHLPRDRPFLLVANHSAGLGIAELTSFMALYLDAVGPQRPLAGFAHPIDFVVPAVARFFRRLGAVPATYEAAAETLAKGVPLLVFPGGDHETMRPLWQAHRVDLGGRRGFLKIARAARVPIIPMGIRGSHFTAPVLWRSRALPWLLVLPRLARLKRWPLTALGALGAIAIAMTSLHPALRALAAWAWLSSPATMLPCVPWRITMRIGAPLEADALFTDDDPDHARALATVQGTLQRLVDAQR